MGRPKGSKNGKYMLVKNVCVQCGIEFETYPSQSRPFCSDQCYQDSREGKSIATCAGCGNEFDYYESDRARVPGSRKYCSRECRYIDSIHSKKCQRCGKHFEEFASRVADGKGKYCSRECSDAARREIHKSNRVVKSCKHCGNKLSVDPYYADKTHFCCRKCAKTGEHNPQWVGGHTIEYPPEWTRSLRKSIKSRDSYKCVLCGQRATDVHHIDYNKYNCDERNLISLCHSCHSRTNTNRRHWIEVFMRMIVEVYEV